MCHFQTIACSLKSRCYPILRVIQDYGSCGKTPDLFGPSQLSSQPVLGKHASWDSIRAVRWLSLMDTIMYGVLTPVGTKLLTVASHCLYSTQRTTALQSKESAKVSDCMALCSKHIQTGNICNIHYESQQLQKRQYLPFTAFGMHLPNISRSWCCRHMAVLINPNKWLGFTHRFSDFFGEGGMGADIWATSKKKQRQKQKKNTP